MKALYADAQKLAGYSYAYVKCQQPDNKSSLDKQIDLNKQKDLDGVLKDGITLVTAKSVLIHELGTDFAQKSGIVGGNFGIFMEESSLLQGDYGLKLKVRYMVKNPFDLFGLGMVSIEQQCMTNAWLGEDYRKNLEDNQNDDQTVYITEHGSVYHVDRNCTYLQHTIQELTPDSLDSRRNLSGGKYYPCEKCGNEQTGHIYVTGYGNRYHSSRNCSVLNRSILAVPKSSVPDRRPCSKCSGGT